MLRTFKIFTFCKKSNIKILTCVCSSFFFFARAVRTSVWSCLLILSCSWLLLGVIEPGVKRYFSNLYQSGSGFGMSFCLNLSKRLVLRNKCLFGRSTVPFLSMTYAADSPTSPIVSIELCIAVCSWLPTVQYSIRSPGQIRFTVIADCKMHLSNLCHCESGFGISS